jgi:hypothetical protein
LRNADLGASPVSTLLLALRGYGRRSFARPAGTLPVRLARFGFTPLREVPGRELVFGLAGRFWRPNGDLRRIPDERAFEAFAEEGCVKAAWNLAIVEASANSCELSTETRIVCFGATARRKFRIYWFVVGPFSGLIRRALLRSIAGASETAETA